MNTTDSYCTFQLDEHHFGIEVERVQEVIRYQQMTEVPLAPSDIRGLLNLRGQIVTALDLRRRLGLPDSASDQEPMNVVVRDKEGAVSLMVDRIGDVLDTEQDAFEPPPETLQGIPRDLIRGAFKMPNHLLLILDTDRVIEPAA